MTTATADLFELEPFKATFRALVGLVIGLFVTLGLFWTMKYLIETSEMMLDESPRIGTLNFVREIRDETPERKEDPIVRPPPPMPEPLTPTSPEMDNLETTNVINWGDFSKEGLKDPMDVNGYGYGLIEGDFLPIVKVAPIYPARALSRGIEGFCVVEYQVTARGTVRNPVVLENQCTSSLFYKTSTEAALKFKYKPRVVNGEAIAVSGVKNRFTFTIEG